MLKVLAEHRARLADLSSEKRSQLLRRLNGLSVHDGASTGSPVVQDEQFIACAGMDHGAERSIAFIHPVGGHAFCYDPLFERLKRHSRTCVVHHPEAALGRRAIARSVVELAQLYRRGVEAGLGCVPSVVGGWSFGGLVALEMASQWEAQGKSLRSVVLIDSPLPGSRGLAQLARTVSEQSSGCGDDAARLERNPEFLAMARALTDLPRSAQSAAGSAWFDALVSVYIANLLAAIQYRFATVRSPVCYMLAARSPYSDSAGGTEAGLGAFALGPRELIACDFDHFEIVRAANLETLERTLRSRLESPVVPAPAELR